ncbi:MAG: hypothetical protein IID61_02125, partial [SAR324 cluster bacterium]|nr:hypothetical protein [SAR324 cluster bacterium]
MATKTHEQTINTALGEVLHDFGQGWSIRSEQVGKIFKEGGRPDILIEKPDGWPIVIEAEVGNHKQAEDEAQSRLNNHLVASTNTIHTAFALVYPEELRNHQGQALRNAILETTLEYVLFLIDADGNTVRFPASGWLSGSVPELAILLHRSSIPSWKVTALADALEKGVNRAEGTFAATHPSGSSLGARVAKILGQVDDNNGQTRRMAMIVVVDALVFHAALAEVEMTVHDQQAKLDCPVKSPSEFRASGTFQPTPLVDEWDKILEVNYWPIFYTAGSIVRILPTQLSASLLDILWATAEELIAGGVTKSHDLTGVIFQKLIADRKFLATYYTRPSCAALLAGLALPLETGGPRWNDVRFALPGSPFGDFSTSSYSQLSRSSSGNWRRSIDGCSICSSVIVPSAIFGINILTAGSLCL